MSLDPNTWTLKTQEAVNAAIELASTSDNPEVTPDHLLVTLISQDNGVVLPVIRKIGLNPLSLRNRTEESLARLPKAYGTDTSISKELTGIFQEATKQRGELKDDYLSTEHLLLALVIADEQRSPAEKRLDGTTNWAVLTTGATLSFAFSSDKNTHVMILINSLLIFYFLYIEARRYQFYDLWRTRVRLMETEFFAEMLTPEREEELENWRQILAGDLHAQHVPVRASAHLLHDGVEPVVARVEAQVVRTHEQLRRAIGQRFRQGPGPRLAVGPEAALVDATAQAVRTPDEIEHEGCGRLCVDLVRRADLFDASAVHHDDAVGQFQRFVLVVGDEDRGVAGGVMDLAQPAPQFDTHLGIECAKRFVEQQHGRINRHRACQRHALPLAAG